MILHIHYENSLFIEAALNCFNISEITCIHIVIGKKRPDNISEKVMFLKIKSKEYYNFLNNKLGEYNLVLFHSLLESNFVAVSDVIRYKSHHTKLAWVIYGAEVHNSFIFPCAFLGIKTRFYYYYLLPYRVFVPFYRMLLRFIGKSLKKYLKEFDYFAHFMPEEIDFIQKKIKIFKPMLWHCYTKPENYIDYTIREKKSVTAGNIIISNYSSFTSNHIEIFDKLKKLNLEGRKIIVPLGYGNRRYKKFINTMGKKYFKEAFTPINEFMDKNSYHNLLLTCSSMILNHYCQQALGNIFLAAWFGMSIYLNDFTTTYKYFKRNGLIIYSIQKDLTSKNMFPFKRLNDEEILHNRKVLTMLFGESVFKEHINKHYLPFC